MYDFVLILSLLYCWVLGGSDLVLGCEKKKKKIIPSSWFHRKFNILKQTILNYFYGSHGYKKKIYLSQEFSVDLRYTIFFLLKEKVLKKSVVQGGVGKMKTNAFFDTFSKTHSIIWLELTYLKMMRLVFPTPTFLSPIPQVKF